MAGVGLLQLRQAGVLFGDDQKVDGGLGIDVAEGQGQIVFVNDISRNLFRHYFVKYCRLS